MFAFLFLFLASLASANQQLIQQSNLQDWWSAAGNFRIGDSAYEVKNIKRKEGVCTMQLQDGALVPVYSGKAPISEKMVGLLFVGKGSVSMEFPDRADAWSFASHMVLRGESTWEDMVLISEQKKPYRVGIDRAFLLSADEDLIKILYNLEPIGSGVLFTEENGEVDASYVVTDSKGKFRAQAIATNILADRTNLLERIGIDPKSMIRQDRILYEELGFPGQQLRAVMDFRTTKRFHVAAQDGGVVGTNNYDKWLTCIRDERDDLQTGFSSMAFSLGEDTDKRFHFQRFSGIPLQKPQSVLMKPVFAKSHIEFHKKNRGVQQEIKVESLLEFEAVGSDLQFVTLRLPTGGSMRGTWKLEELSLEDGTTIAWAGLNAALYSKSGRLFSNDQTNQVLDGNNLSTLSRNLNSTDDVQANNDLSSQQDLGTSSESGGGNVGGVDIGSAERIEAYPNGDPNQSFQIGNQEQNAADRLQSVYQESEYRYDIMAILPKVVKRGEHVKVRLVWSATLNFANILTSETSQGISAQSAGATTGLNPYLPEVLPNSGGNIWKFETTVGAPARTNLIRPQVISTSGRIKDQWQDEGLWNWLETEGKGIRPSVGLGRWVSYREPGTEGYPDINIHLFPNSYSFAAQFPPEARRIINFLQRFLPVFPLEDLDLFQSPSTTIFQKRISTLDDNRMGVVEIERVTSPTVGRGGEIRDGDSSRAQREMAVQIAGQYWGQMIPSLTQRDLWISSVLSESYALFYLRAAISKEVYEERIQELRRQILDPVEYDFRWKRADALRRNYSLTGGTQFSDIPTMVTTNYGVYVLSEMLRLRIGNQAFFASLEDIAQEDVVTTKMLQQHFEKYSSMDLHDFFDFWIHSGFIPSIDISLHNSTEKDGMLGCIKSDIPFGVFEVPLRIFVGTKKEPKGVSDAFVKMNQGQGQFFIPQKDVDDIQIEVDPLGLSLIRSATIKKKNSKSSCLE